MKKLLLICAISFLGNLVINAQVPKINSTQGTVFSTGPNHISRTFTYVGGDFTSCAGLTEVEIAITLTMGSDASGSCNPAIGGYSVQEDMNLRLVSPTGTFVDLVQDKWGYWTGVNPQPNTLSSFVTMQPATVLFDDDAAVTINGDYSTNPVARPHNVLSAFDGENPVGVWTLHISDGNGLFSAVDYICFSTATLTITCGTSCTDPDVPTISATPSTICPGSSSTLDWAGANLNDASAWHIYTSSCGVTQLTTATGTSLVVSPATTTTYFIRGEDGAGCVDESTGICGSVTVTVQDITNPTISCPATANITTDAGNCTSTAAIGTATGTDNCGTPTITNNAPASFPIGNTNITWSSTDGAGNFVTCVQVVTVTDGENPTINCPATANIITDAGVCTSTTAIGTATGTDNCGTPTITNNAPASFPIGNTNVTWTSTDGVGNFVACVQVVTVTDGENPTISCPATANITTDAGNCTSTAAIGTATGTDNCGSPTITNNAPASFPIGNTNVTWTSTDGAGNFVTCVQVVTVTDGENPIITCPGNQTGFVDAFCNFTLLDYTGLAVVSDNCTASPTITQLPAPGVIVGIGIANIVLTTTDGSGNMTICAFDVLVLDTISPLAICQNVNLYLDATGNATLGTIALDGGSVDNCAGFLTVTPFQTAFTCFNLGPNTVTLTVADQNGNTSFCSAIVTVIDTISPTISCAVDITACEGDVVSFNTPNGADNCFQAVLQTDGSGLSSGVVFPVGTTTIEFTSTDASGNSAVCTFNVDVTSIDNTVTDAAPLLTANQTSATYQWLDCNNGNAIIPTETNQGFTASSNGSYAVEITIGNCVDTSACINVIISSIDNNLFTNQLTIYPNPTSGNVSIGLGKLYDEITIKVMNVKGQLVKTKTYQSTNKIDFNLKGEKGVYFVEIVITEGDKTTLKLLKQ
jgi:hypothetical protein